MFSFGLAQFLIVSTYLCAVRISFAIMVRLSQLSAVGGLQHQPCAVQQP